MSKTYTLVQLQEIYGIGNTTIKERIKGLNIRPSDKGEKNASLYSEESKRLLDDLARHLKEGGNINNFIPASKTEILPPLKISDRLPSDSQTAIVKSQPKGALVKASRPPSRQKQRIEKIKQAIELSDDPFSDLEILGRYSENDWLPTTAELAAIIGLSPSTLQQYQSYVHGGFILSQEVNQYGKGKEGLVTLGKTVFWRIKSNAS